MLKVVASYDSSLHPVTARDGAEALEVLLNPLRLPRLVLMDLALPKLAGTEVLRELRRNSHTRDLPVVLFSGSERPGDMEEGYRSGANSWVIKPVLYEKYRETLTGILSY